MLLYFNYIHLSTNPWHNQYPRWLRVTCLDPSWIWVSYFSMQEPAFDTIGGAVKLLVWTDELEKKIQQQ